MGTPCLPAAPSSINYHTFDCHNSRVSPAETRLLTAPLLQREPRSRRWLTDVQPQHQAPPSARLSHRASLQAAQTPAGWGATRYDHMFQGSNQPMRAGSENGQGPAHTRRLQVKTTSHLQLSVAEPQQLPGLSRCRAHCCRCCCKLTRCCWLRSPLKLPFVRHHEHQRCR